MASKKKTVSNKIINFNIYNKSKSIIAYCEYGLCIQYTNYPPDKSKEHIDKLYSNYNYVFPIISGPKYTRQEPDLITTYCFESDIITEFDCFSYSCIINNSLKIEAIQEEIFSKIEQLEDKIDL